jgi:hypothetical protein
MRYTLIPAHRGYVLSGGRSQHPPSGSREDWLAVADALGGAEVERDHVAQYWHGTQYVLVDPAGPMRLPDVYYVPPGPGVAELAAHIREVVA